LGHVLNLCNSSGFATFAGTAMRPSPFILEVFAALCALTIAGCGFTAKTDAPTVDPRAEYQSSLDAYQACVNSNLNNVNACEDKRVQMETSERAYRNR